MHLPEPIPTAVHGEMFAGVTYHIRGSWRRAAGGDRASGRDVRAPRAAVEGDAAEYRAEENLTLG